MRLKFISPNTSLLNALNISLVRLIYWTTFLICAPIKKLVHCFWKATIRYLWHYHNYSRSQCGQKKDAHKFDTPKLLQKYKIIHAARSIGICIWVCSSNCCSSNFHCIFDAIMHPVMIFWLKYFGLKFFIINFKILWLSLPFIWLLSMQFDSLPIFHEPSKIIPYFFHSFESLKPLS